MSKPQHIWLVTHNFPPEVNALATRSFEHAREWAKAGHSFDVITDVPHFPEGKVYASHHNRFQHEVVEGVSVYRMPVYAAENRRRIRRTLSYLSFMLSCILCSPWVRQKPTLILASSPQIFTAFAGYFLSVLYRVPFVMEVRDLWPQSISAVGAMKKKSLLLRFITYAVHQLYRRAQRIVVLTQSFKQEIMQQGIPESKIVFVPNGISAEFAQSMANDQEVAALRAEHGLEGKFVASYIGTLGMAHGLDTILEAARLVTNPNVRFVILGTGASRRELQAKLKDSGLTNVLLLPKVPRELARVYLQLSDVTMVLLRDLPLFRTVIPSKLLEAMGCGRPVILGVQGEAADVLEKCGGGVAITPESAEELARTVDQLAGDDTLRHQLGRDGQAAVLENFNRRELASQLWGCLCAEKD